MGEKKIEVEVKCDDLSHVFVHTFLKSLTPEKAKEFMSEAVQDFLRKDYNVQRALEAVALQTVMEELRANVEWRERIQGLVRQAMEKVLDGAVRDNGFGARDLLVERIAKSIVKGLTQGHV